MGRASQQRSEALLAACRDRQWGDALRLVREQVRPCPRLLSSSRPIFQAVGGRRFVR